LQSLRGVRNPGQSRNAPFSLAYPLRCEVFRGGDGCSGRSPGVLRSSEMVRPSPRRLLPRNKHEIGALSAVWAEGNRSDHRVLIVVRPRNGGVGAQDAIAERLAECLASSAPIASRPRAVAMP